MVLPAPIIYAFAAAFGLVIGSFLNVCIHRLPRGESVVSPPSRCPACGRPVRWFDNVPVVSWLLLRGRCRACGAPISAVYPLVEALTGALFAAQVWLVGLDDPALLAARLVFGCSMILLFFTDLQQRILPDVVTLPGVAIGFLFSLIQQPGWVDSLLGVLLGGGGLYVTGELYYRLRGEEGLGGGDVKMVAMIGAFLGWRLMLVTLMLSSVLGSIIGLACIPLLGKKYLWPFGSFLALGALVAAAAGDRILAWYLSFYP
jgi:leader peptidase (prepilin peptidase)/N-methyltransferase